MSGPPIEDPVTTEALAELKARSDRFLNGRRGLAVVEAEALPARRTRWLAADLLSADLPEPRWAVPDLIPEGLTILAGRPKKGKSRLALGLALAIAGGTPALGHFDLEHAGEVLFVGLEDNERRLQDRLQDMLGSRSAPPTLELWTALPKLGDGCEAALDTWLIAHPNARLIVIDTYQRVRRPQTGRDGNPYALDYEEAAALQRLAIGRGIAIVLVMHTRKPVGGGDPFDEVLGSTGNTASADALLVLQTERGRADAKLLVVGRDVEEAEHALQTDHLSGQWVRIGDAADVRRSSQREAILAALRAAAPKGLKPFEIARHVQQPGPRVRLNLMRMKNDGEVTLENGAYFVRAGPSAATPETPETVEMQRNGNAETFLVAPVAGVAAVSPVSAPARLSWTCDCGTSVMRGYPCPTCGRREEATDA